MSEEAEAVVSGAIAPAPRRHEPFSREGVIRRPDGAAYYTGRPRSLPAMLAGVVQDRAEAVAVVEVGGDRVTYAELWDRSSRVAAGLRKAGVGPGDRVAIRLPNGLDWVVAFWAIQVAGAVAVPINIRLSEPEVEYQLTDSGSSFCFEADAGLPEADPIRPADPGSDELAAIFYTSGTTGRPKGAMVTHANFLTNSENAFRTLRAPRQQAPEISTLISVPLFHVTGCNSQMISVLEGGGRVEILPRALDLELFLHAVVEHGINHLVSVPAIYYALINSAGFAAADVSGVRWVAYGGAPTSAEMVRRIKGAFPRARVGNGFGLTETSSLTSFLPDEDSAAHPDSIGYPMPVVDIALDLVDSGEGVGELLVRGPNVVAGYWRAPEASAAAFVDGWLRTGDLARMDDDGRLYIVDRSKDMINRGGENVYSVEVENALAASPGVGEAAVVGVPDEMMGEKVGAVLVAAPGQEIVIDEVLADLRSRIADYKVPQYISVSTDPLPRNPGGKVVKARLADSIEWGPPLR